MKIGYARTSTLDQVAGLEAQLAELKEAGCERIFHEQVSSVGDRPQLALALDFLRDSDDSLVVTKLDRLARSVPHLLEIVAKVQAKGARLCIRDLGSLDPETVPGKLMLTILGAIAAFEREMMLERQREGIAKAKAEGKYTGRQPTARAKGAEVRRLAAEGIGKAEIARRLEIGERSVYRILAEEHMRVLGAEVRRLAAEGIGK